MYQKIDLIFLILSIGEEIITNNEDIWDKQNSYLLDFVNLLIILNRLITFPILPSSLSIEDTMTFLSTSSSFPLLRLTTCTSSNFFANAFNFDEFYLKIDNFNAKDFAIVSRISESKKIDESILGFLNSEHGSCH